MSGMQINFMRKDTSCLGSSIWKCYCFESYTVLVHCRLSQSWLHLWLKTEFVFQQCGLRHNVTHYTFFVHT